MGPINYKTVDFWIFIIANIVNLSVIGIMISRTKQLPNLEYYFGLLIVFVAIPLTACVIFNIAENRDWWTIVLPMFLVVFCVIEFLLDYVFKVDFRVTVWLWPYLIIFYSGLMGMIGYSFLIGRSYGFITLCTYFINLLATWYSYSQVGHG
jgi:hypothetical protein